LLLQLLQYHDRSVVVDSGKQKEVLDCSFCVWDLASPETFVSHLYKCGAVKLINCWCICV